MGNTNTPRDPTGEYMRAYQTQIDEAQEVATQCEEKGSNFSTTVEADVHATQHKNFRVSRSTPRKKHQQPRQELLDSFMHPANLDKPRRKSTRKEYPLTFLGTPISPPRYTLDDLPPAYDAYPPHPSMPTVPLTEVNLRVYQAGQKDDDEPTISLRDTRQAEITQITDLEEDGQKLVLSPHSSKNPVASSLVLTHRPLRRIYSSPTQPSRRTRFSVIKRPDRSSRRILSRDFTRGKPQGFPRMDAMNASIAAEPHHFRQVPNGQTQLYRHNHQYQTHAHNQIYQPGLAWDVKRIPGSQQGSGVQHQWARGFPPLYGFQHPYDARQVSGIQHEQGLEFQPNYGFQHPHVTRLVSGVQHPPDRGFQPNHGLKQSLGTQQGVDIQGAGVDLQDVGIHYGQRNQAQTQIRTDGGIFRFDVRTKPQETAPQGCACLLNFGVDGCDDRVEADVVGT